MGDLLLSQIFDFRFFLCLDGFPLYCLADSSRGCLSLPSFESFDSAGGVDDFLFAGVERVAVRADVGFDLFNCRAGNKNLPASADNLCLLKICWVDSVFHIE